MKKNKREEEVSVTTSRYLQQPVKMWKEVLSANNKQRLIIEK